MTAFVPICLSENREYRLTRRRRVFTSRSGVSLVIIPSVFKDISSFVTFGRDVCENDGFSWQYTRDSGQGGEGGFVYKKIVFPAARFPQASTATLDRGYEASLTVPGVR